MWVFDFPRDHVSVPNPATDYTAAVQIKQFTYRNGVAATFTYNQRLQLASLRYVNGSTDLLNLAYEYGTGQQQSNNNGQIRKIKYYTSPGVEGQTKSQNYEYDAWGRLRRAWTTNLATENTWKLEWDYDRFGNRRNQNLTGRRNQNLTGGNTSVTTPQLSISSTTNRIDTAGYVYDAAGNLTNDSLHVYTYDAENRIKNTDFGNQTNQNVYTYFGALRVKKVTGNPATTTTVYIFSGTKVIAEYVNGALSKEYIYSGSALLATHEGPTGATLRYHHPDHLGTRVDTDTAGGWTRKFGHFPFGEVWYEDLQAGAVATKLKFTSYERDSESGLDQAMFRYDSSRLGRFMSPDLLAGSIVDPQSINRYVYTRNDPVNLVDPTGLVFDCLLDGFETPCSLVYNLVSIGAAGVCVFRSCDNVRFTDEGWWVLTSRSSLGPCEGAYGNYCIRQEARFTWVLIPASVFETAAQLAAQRLVNSPWAGSYFIPTGPPLLSVKGVPVAVGGINITGAVIPQTNTVCLGAGPGIAAPPTKGWSVGPLWLGNVNNSQAILSGGSFSATGQPSPLIGGQAIMSPGNGNLGGPTLGSPGASVAGTYSVCGNFGGGGSAR
jgi:RHS repeat-associated protein